MKIKSFAKGEANVLAIMAILTTLTTLAFGGTAIYYISQYKRVQTSVDQAKMDATAAAKLEQKQVDQAAFDETLKSPYRIYVAPAIFGRLVISFPKNWNIYVDATEGSSAQLNLFMNPSFVPSQQNYQGAYALRLTVQPKLYQDVVKDQEGAVQAGELAADPITVSNIKGTHYVGKLVSDHEGFMVILPVRDKTLSIWTEDKSYEHDFNIILAKLKVSP